VFTGFVRFWFLMGAAVCRMCTRFVPFTCCAIGNFLPFFRVCICVFFLCKFIRSPFDRPNVVCVDSASVLIEVGLGLGFVTS